MVRTCVIVFGPPCSGKTGALLRLLQEQEDRHTPEHSPAAARFVLLSIGDYIRASKTTEPPERLAEQALEAACARMPSDGVLVLDGVKRASHIYATLAVLARHGVQLSAAVELSSSYRAGSRGRPDDAVIGMRQKRYDADQSLLISALQASTKVPAHL